MYAPLIGRIIVARRMGGRRVVYGSVAMRKDYSPVSLPVFDYEYQIRDMYVALQQTSLSPTIVQ